MLQSCQLSHTVEASSQQGLSLETLFLPVGLAPLDNNSLRCYESQAAQELWTIGWFLRVVRYPIDRTKQRLSTGDLRLKDSGPWVKGGLHVHLQWDMFFYWEAISRHETSAAKVWATSTVVQQSAWFILQLQRSATFLDCYPVEASAHCKGNGKLPAHILTCGCWKDNGLFGLDS